MKRPLLVIVGPTGVGKTAVAVKLAGRLPLEVVSADSRQLYRGMDIATGKPTRQERAAVPHHLIDLIDPDERYNVARFRADALPVIDAIHARGRLPAVVGGTGLYVRALLKGLRPAPPADPALRQALEETATREGAAALHARLASVDPLAARRLHPNDRVRIIRALELHTLGAFGADRPPHSDGGDTKGNWETGVSSWRALMIGLTRPREILRAAVAARARDMVSRGMMQEVERLLAAGYDPSLPSMGGIGYRQFVAVRRDGLDPREALRLMIRDTGRYARRQLSWFARDREIRWIDVDAAGGIEGTVELVLKQITRGGLIE